MNYMDIYLYNSLTRKKEKFIPLKEGEVGMYTCGPTVYDVAHIGNFRTYIFSDTLARVLSFNGLEVTHIMNLTDVGHLTGDNLGDADTGEDRLEKAAKKERRTAWDVAKKYSGIFLKDIKKVNINSIKSFPKPTEHIEEQIDLVKKLEVKGFTYKTSDGIYFDTKKYEDSGKKYGELSTLDEIKEGARVEKNLEKKNPRDFVLWKFSPDGAKRDMEWESPWGIGFPGWHIECSAMGMKYLGESFDIHVGGEDLRSTHHPNEIAQSEGATGKKYVNYWLHGTFLKIDGERMSKSKGNAFTISDVEEKNFDPLALRYLFLTANYRDPLNFTWKSLEGAQKALERLRNHASAAKEGARKTLSKEKEKKVVDYRDRFLESINDDVNMPQAVAVVWEMLKSNVPSSDKYDLLMSFDEVLGLKLNQASKEKTQIPEEALKLVEERNSLRKEGKFKEADKVRDKIRDMGFSVKDDKEESKLTRA